MPLEDKLKDVLTGLGAAAAAAVAVGVVYCSFIAPVIDSYEEGVLQECIEVYERRYPDMDAKMRRYVERVCNK
ncbi:hypothetical protein HQ545_08335 [Candidatus Woesearchaeota archaeon]|nr:hypothetical protein [Candidatus Woesearchaeota archaeon]